MHLGRILHSDEVLPKSDDFVHQANKDSLHEDEVFWFHHFLLPG